ncbi:MAG: deoxynucleoside kinase [Clostridia bacterium]|nr:deoxynucleoside kinase [Clostridia bacterium]
MANSKLIVVEGPQGAGKTTVTDFIRHKIPYTNLYRLSGSSDNTPSGKPKSVSMYNDLLDYIEKLQNKSINLVFDRTFFTEYVYCNLGFKEFDYREEFLTFLERFASFDFDIYYINLYLSDTDEFEARLARDGKGVNKYAKFSKESSVKQQDEYMKVASEIQEKYGDKIHVVNIDTCVGIDKVKEQIASLLS